MPRLQTIALGTVVASAALVLMAGAADAHVTVTAPGATRGGGDQLITFRVPVEEDADTVGLTISLPVATPIASVDAEPIAGWTHHEVSATLAKPIKTDDGNITSAVTRITWTADPGHGLVPGEFGAFTILAGQLPDSATITFRALQTYSNGTVVRWIETAAPGSTDEPEHPAPVLTLGAAQPDDAAPSAAPTAAAAKASSSSSNTAPVVLSIVALVLAAAALGLGVVARARASG